MSTLVLGTPTVTPNQISPGTVSVSIAFSCTCTDVKNPVTITYLLDTRMEVWFIENEKQKQITEDRTLPEGNNGCVKNTSIISTATPPSPTAVTLRITATDKGGLTSMKTVQITLRK